MTNKIDRDALKEPDEFVRTVSRGAEWAKRNQRTLILGLAVLVVVLLAGSVTAWNRTRRNLQAVEQFRHAQAAFKAQSWANAADEFALLAREYPRTGFGRIAGLYVGHARRAAGDSAGAAEAYEAFLATAPKSSEAAQLATLALAQLREDAQEPEAALDLYAQPGTLAGPYRIEAGISKARIEAGLGKADAAKQTYEEILPDASGAARQLVESELAMLTESR